MARWNGPGGVTVEPVELTMATPPGSRKQRTIPPGEGRKYAVSLHGFYQGSFTEAGLAAVLDPAEMTKIRELTS